MPWIVSCGVARAAMVLGLMTFQMSHRDGLISYFGNDPIFIYAT
jgi:hypothetical protein